MTTPPTPDGLRVGFVRGVTLTKWTTTWRERFPGVPLAVVEIDPADQRRQLIEAELDLCFVRLPLEPQGLHLIRLYEESPVVWVAKEHPLAAFAEVATADLAGEVVLAEATSQAINQVALEVAVLAVPMSIARSHSRRDLVYRPLTDAPSTTVGLAWRIDNQHPAIDEFIGVVRGRTANSSRSEQERRANPKQPTKQPTAPAKAAAKAAAKPGRRTPSPRRPRRR